MPQLDKITFLPQYFWLSIFFFTFYLISLKQFLPKLSRIFKFRKKMISQTTESVVTTEIREISDSIDTLVYNLLQISRTSLSQHSQQALNWLKDTLQKGEKTHFKKSKAVFLESVATNSLSQELALFPISLNLTKKFTLTLVLNLLRKSKL